jgi:hypothetical protein
MPVGARQMEREAERQMTPRIGQRIDPSTFRLMKPLEDHLELLSQIKNTYPVAQ